MATNFTPELGETLLELIRRKNFKVCYEFRHHGELDKRQTFEEVFDQVAQSLEIGPRYHLFPSQLSFDVFTMALAADRVEPPWVTIAGERRILFGFGLREDHCFFVTHTILHPPTADRQRKDYDYMLNALRSLEEFTTGR